MSNKTKKKNSNIGYSGEVVVKTLQGKKVVKTSKKHNDGTLSLFTYLATCLASTYEERLAPRFLRGFYVQGLTPTSFEPSNLNIQNLVTDIVSFKSLSVESVEADPDEEIPASASATLSFLIPSTLIDGSQINVLALYSYDTFSEASMSTPLAYVLLDEEEVVDCDNGVNILVEWKLTVSSVE